MKEEKIFFENSDGLRLCGLLSVPPQETHKMIVLCHGITVDKEEDGIYTELAGSLRDAGFAVFRFDFRGHGESQGPDKEMTVTGEKRDLDSAIRLLRGRGFSEFGLVASSFAGGPACLYCGDNPDNIKALSLWNALIDYSSKKKPVTEWGKKYWGQNAFERAQKYGFIEIGSRNFKVGKKAVEEVWSLEPWKGLKKLKIPIQFIHGDSDTYVPYKDSVKYSQMFGGELLIIEGAEHGFHDRKEDAEKADKATVDFLRKNML